MAYCGKSVPSSPSRNYECMRKGIGVGRNVKLPRGYVPEHINQRHNLYCGKKKRVPSSKQKGYPFECFRKGFSIGKQLQYNTKYRGRENFDKENFFAVENNSRTLLLAFLIMIIVFGLLFVIEVYWAWSLFILLGLVSLHWFYFRSLVLALLCNLKLLQVP